MCANLNQSILITANQPLSTLSSTPVGEVSVHRRHVHRSTLSDSSCTDDTPFGPSSSPSPSHAKSSPGPRRNAASTSTRCEPAAYTLQLLRATTLLAGGHSQATRTMQLRVCRPTTQGPLQPAHDRCSPPCYRRRPHRTTENDIKLFANSLAKCKK